MLQHFFRTTLNKKLLFLKTDIIPGFFENRPDFN